MHASAPAPCRGLVVSLAAALLVSASALSASAAGTAPQSQEADGPECLVGTWAIDTAADGAQVAEALSAEATDVTVPTGEGDATLTFTSDTMTFAYDNESITEEYTRDGHRYVYRFVTNGSSSAHYEATDDTIDLDAPSGDVYSVDTLTMDGVRVEDPSTASYLPQVPWGLHQLEGAWRYTCSGDALTITWFKEDGFGDAVQTFTRRAPGQLPATADPTQSPARPAAARGAAARPAAAAAPVVGAPAFTG